MTDPRLPDLPEWTKRDDLGGLVPSEVRTAMRQYGLSCYLAGLERAAMIAADTWEGSNHGPDGESGCDFHGENSSVAILKLAAAIRAASKGEEG